MKKKDLLARIKKLEIQVDVMRHELDDLLQRPCQQIYYPDPKIYQPIPPVTYRCNCGFDNARKD
jgi:hypothetical protein